MGWRGWMVAGLERQPEFRLHSLCSQSPQNVCAELGFSETKRTLVSGGGEAGH